MFIHLHDLVSVLKHKNKDSSRNPQTNHCNYSKMEHCMTQKSTKSIEHE